MSENKVLAASEEMLTEQLAFALRVKELLGKRYNHKPKAYVNTFGCQQNVSDSEKYQGLLETMGYEFTDKTDDADFVLYNTCAVREHAEDRVYGNIGMLKAVKQQRKDMIIAVCGCMAQQQIVSDKIKKSYPYVDILFGTGVRHKLPEFIYKKITQGKRVFDTSEGVREIIENIPTKRDSTYKAWVPIMQGCNNFCTYCIVPYVRGRESSRSCEAVINEVKALVNNGVKEIMLLGQNVNSYGKQENFDVSFADLLRKVNAIPGDFRIRFMTSHPKDCTDELLLAMSECEKVERHLHLPVQSGSDRILKEMNRRYTAEKYLSLIKKAKSLMPDICFTSDIIVGFPGETYEDFYKTLELVKKVEYSQLFTFIYSARPGTPAAEMPDPISREEKGKWFNELLVAQEENAAKIKQSFVGKTLRVLCEEKLEDGLFAGKSSQGLAVSFKSENIRIGQFADVFIEAVNDCLLGIERK